MFAYCGCFSSLQHLLSCCVAKLFSQGLYQGHWGSVIIGLNQADDYRFRLAVMKDQVVLSDDRKSCLVAGGPTAVAACLLEESEFTIEGDRHRYCNFCGGPALFGVRLVLR